GQPPAIQDWNPDRPEEFLDFACQPRSPTDEESQSASSQPVPQRRQHQSVRQSPLRAQDGTRTRGAGETRADSDGPVEDGTSRRAGFLHARHHGRIHLFVDARNAAHDRRLDLLKLLSKVVGASRDPCLSAVDEADEDLVDPPIDVRVWEPRKGEVLVGDRMDLDRGSSVVNLYVIGMLDSLR